MAVREIDLDVVLKYALLIVEKAALFIREHVDSVYREDIIEKGVNSLVSYVDRTSERILVEGLSSIIADVGFITEEEMTEQRMGNMTWIIDPLDGTTNFLNKVPHFSVSVGLYDGQSVVLGIVYDVMASDVYTAIVGQGAFCNEDRIHVTNKPDFYDVLVATGFPYTTDQLSSGHLEALDQVLRQTRGIRRLGSAAIDLCYVAKGVFGSFYENSLNAYDIAAGSLIVQEAGGIISDFKGKDHWLFEGEILATAPQFKEDMLGITSHFYKH